MGDPNERFYLGLFFVVLGALVLGAILGGTIVAAVDRHSTAAQACESKSGEYRGGKCWSKATVIP